MKTINPDKLIEWIDEKTILIGQERSEVVFAKELKEKILSLSTSQEEIMLPSDIEQKTWEWAKKKLLVAKRHYTKIDNGLIFAFIRTQLKPSSSSTEKPKQMSVEQLLVKREEIDSKIIALDKNALINYALKKLQED